MNTREQQDRNTQKSKILKETLKDQTIFTQSTRSHTITSNKGVPVYQNKIYEFDENDVDGIKKFI